MCITTTPAARRRPGFTLVELLVVTVIIIILASLAVAFLPNLNDQRKASNGAGLVQSALLTAKQRAKRDQAPRGIRLIRDSTVQSDPRYNQASTIQFIEQPDNFSEGNVIALQPTQTPTIGVSFDTTKPTAVFTGTDLFGGFPNTPAQWAVQPGDYLVIQQTLVYRITLVTSGGVPTNPPNTGDTVQVVSSFPYSAQASYTNDYYIIRCPRPLLAEPPVTLPQDVAIDLTGVGQGIPVSLGSSAIGLSTGAFSTPVNTSLIIPDTITDNNGSTIESNLDILFAPSGRVIRQGTKTGKFILWVRDITRNLWDGDQVLVTVYTRTGLVATHPADPTNPNNPYTFTQDGLDTGE